MKIISLPRGGQALARFLTLPISGPVLDIGSGVGLHASIMFAAGLDVVTLDPVHPADITSSWPVPLDPPEVFGAVWACHVLEHSRNPGAFLECCRANLRPGGWLAVTVPPAKHAIVGGHVGLWNAGLLLYHLVLAGFDCRQAMVRSYGYNISVIVQRIDADLPALVHDEGDIEALAPFFPLPVAQDFDGRIESLNWGGDHE